MRGANKGKRLNQRGLFRHLLFLKKVGKGQGDASAGKETLPWESEGLYSSCSNLITKAIKIMSKILAGVAVAG